jgi:hypothetical protein
MNNARIPHAKPKATSINGTRELKGIRVPSALDESAITIYLLVVRLVAMLAKATCPPLTVK